MPWITRGAATASPASARPGNTPAALFAELSAAKRRVACGAILGLQNKVIAYHLELSDGTVRNTMTQVLERFGLSRRTQLQALFRDTLSLPKPELIDATPAAAPERDFTFEFETGPAGSRPAHGVAV